MRTLMTNAFLESDTPGVIGGIKDYFKYHNYSLWHLFKEEQQKILNQVLGSTMDDIETSFRQIYDHHYPLMQIKNDISLPLPRMLMTVVEFVLNRDISAALEAEDVDIKRFKQLVEEMKRWSFKRDQANFTFLASQRISSLMNRLSDHPDNIHLMEKIITILELLGQLSLDLDLWKAQNTYFAMGRKIYPDIISRAGTDELAGRWVKLFEHLGEILQVKVTTHMHKRHSGILLHITSLPSKYGIGDMGPFAYAFVDFLNSCGQKYWQILPINPTDGLNGNSPYSCFSAFAGNALLISPEMMVIEGFLSPSEVNIRMPLSEEKVDYSKVRAFKEKIFNAAYRRFQKNSDREDFDRFVRAQHYWLEDFALFTVIKAVYGGRSWNEWPRALKTRQAQALKKFHRRNFSELERAKFIQYLFFRQWHKLKDYANSKNVAIIGDIPFMSIMTVWRSGGIRHFLKLIVKGI